ncbi:alpha-galactosidase [Butyrivibrio sp. X503]|uniref:glycoside hydrolase family 36 protein n=1 Tax=Butyrivibrio sp. X503 TaxID=2364878 RepID=UPI000EA8AA80|nr:glycoside hydrolase family 36 protein [Butyrivibrio sp. X503]RKM55824.1 alpha-galactosidase [Butyrivibrio sp. X503]
MNLGAEIRLLGDAYEGGFSCGMTMAYSETSRNLKRISKTTQGDGKVTLLEDKRGYKVRVVEKRAGEAIRVHTEFENCSDKEAVIELISSFALSDIKADKFHRMQSFWSAEGKLRTETVEDLHLERSWSGHGRRAEKFGNVGSMPVRKYFPFLVLEDSETGHFTGILMGNASSWQMEFSCKETQNFDVHGGIADREFGHWNKTVAAGEVFVTPDAIIAEGESLLDVCDKLVKAQRPDVSPVDMDLGIIFNEYCTSWGNPNADNVKRLSDKLEGRGIKYLVIDAGWYGLANDWMYSVGNWEINTERFPNGFKEVTDYIRSKGMIPGLWFELEVVATNSKYFNETEHLLKKDGYPVTVGGRRFLDMEDPWVTEHLTKDVIGTLKDNGFGYLKIDYNETIGMGCDGHDSLGDSLYSKIEASKRFIEKIKEEIPGIVIEICSSGGHRLVYSMLELASQASFSDAHETTAIPIIAANVHRVMNPFQSQIWSVLREKDDDSRLYYSLCATLLGRMCLSGDIYDLSDEHQRIVDEAIAFYGKASDIIKYGKTTLIKCDTIGYNEPTGQQLVVREFEGEKLVVYHRFKDSEPLTYELSEGNLIIAKFGVADRDFSACAMIVRD